MLIKKPRAWELSEAKVTPEHIFLNRRHFMTSTTAAFAALSHAPTAWAQRVDEDPSKAMYPFKRNEKYIGERAITPEEVNGAYNNFIEFGNGKSTARAAQALKLRPWVITIDGMVEKPMDIGIDDLIRAMPQEERVYRLRCVETWAMTIPWSGFALKALIDFIKPLSSARYVRFETFMDPSIAPAQKRGPYAWPYVEGLTIAEATNELAFIATGTYGKPAAKAHGAPLRLAIPWKYGFKSIKSIKRITLTDQRPRSMWENLQSEEYGFWANVNPEVPHPRWSQATEEVLGTHERVPTKLFNGYAEFVGDLYKGLEKERLYT